MRRLLNSPIRRARDLFLVHLHVPLALFLEAADKFFVVEALLLAHPFQHVKDAWHHAFQAAKVHVRALVEPPENIVRVLLNLVLDVHLATLRVVLLAAQRVVQLEVVGVLRRDGLMGAEKRFLYIYIFF